MDFFSIVFMYINLGLEHIITGYDHLLFLLALVLAANRFVDALKIVTAFTIAHSLTLFLAVLELVPVYPKWVEAGIALTICYVAAENFFVNRANSRWALTFVFGLIHGLGFASSIREIGFDKAHFVASLISFNVGIEMGQIAAAAIALPILFKLRSNDKIFTGVYRGTSACILLISGYWFVVRILG